MKVAVFSTKPYDRRFLEEENRRAWHDLSFFEARLEGATAPLARGNDAVCAFVNDDLGRPVLQALSEGGTRLIALRCAGFNNVDLEAAGELGMTVVRVPAYSPYAVAEHTMGLILALNRKLHRAHARVREGNFALQGLLGFDLHGKTVGVVGTGRIGEVFAGICLGFGCTVLAHDIRTNPACEEKGVRYVPLDELLAASDVVSLHCPLTPQTHHTIGSEAVAKMKHGAMLINTSRGGLVDTRAAIDGLKSGRLGALGLDVYEEEADLFFEDLSDTVLKDDVFARLLTFPNVLITGHQAFFTEEALRNIAGTTLDNIGEFESSGAGACANAVGAERVKATG